jgi:WD40 repeat protein
LPGDKYFTVVRVEEDSTQRIWKINRRTAKSEMHIKNIDSVGYYCEVDKNRYAMFLVTEPSTLIIAGLADKTGRYVDSNIGRCIRKIPGENAICYLTKEGDDAWHIKKLDLATNNISLITKIPAGSEDFAWTSDGNLFMAKNSTLYYYDYMKTNKWYEFADMQDYGVDNIYRLTFSHDGKWLAFVANEPASK